MDVVLGVFNKIVLEKVKYYESRIQLISHASQVNNKFDKNACQKLIFKYVKKDSNPLKDRDDFIKIDRNKKIEKIQETEDIKKIRNLSITNFYKSNRKKNNSMGDLKDFTKNYMRNIVLDESELRNTKELRMTKEKEENIIKKFGKTREILHHNAKVMQKHKNEAIPKRQEDNISSMEQVINNYKQHQKERDMLSAKTPESPEIKKTGSLSPKKSSQKVQVPVKKKTFLESYLEKQKSERMKSNLILPTNKMVFTKAPSKTFQFQIPVVPEKKDIFDNSLFEAESDYSEDPKILIKNSIRILPHNIRDRFNECVRLNSVFLKPASSVKTLLNDRKKIHLNPKQ